MNARIVVRKGESITLALRRLQHELQRTGAIWEVRRRKHPADPTQKRRAKRFQKRFKSRRATLLAQQAGEQPVASLKAARERFWVRTGKP